MLGKPNQGRNHDSLLLAVLVVSNTFYCNKLIACPFQIRLIKIYCESLGGEQILVCMSLLPEPLGETTALDISKSLIADLKRITIPISIRQVLLQNTRLCIGRLHTFQPDLLIFQTLVILFE